MSIVRVAKYRFDCVSNTLYLSEKFYENAGQYCASSVHNYVSYAKRGHSYDYSASYDPDNYAYARTNPESIYERFEDIEDLNIIDDALFIAANEKGFDAEEYIKEAFWFEYDGEPGSEIRSAAIACIRG